MSHTPYDEPVKPARAEQRPDAAAPPETPDAPHDVDDAARGEAPTWEYVQANWERLAPRVQARWPKLSGHELTTAAGDHDALVAVIEKRYGLEPAEARRQVDGWLEDLDAGP